MHLFEGGANCIGSSITAVITGTFASEKHFEIEKEVGKDFIKSEAKSITFFESSK
jgi:hypothetical protein